MLNMSYVSGIQYYNLQGPFELTGNNIFSPVYLHPVNCSPGLPGIPFGNHAKTYLGLLPIGIYDNLVGNYPALGYSNFSNVTLPFESLPFVAENCISPMQSLLMQYRYDDVVTFYASQEGSYNNRLGKTIEYIAELYPIEIDYLIGSGMAQIQQPMSYLYRAHRISSSSSLVSNPYASGDGFRQVPPFQEAGIVKQTVSHYEVICNNPRFNSDHMNWPPAVYFQQSYNGIGSCPERATGLNSNTFAFRNVTSNGSLALPNLPAYINLQLSDLTTKAETWPTGQIEDMIRQGPPYSGLPMLNLAATIGNPDLFKRNIFASQEIRTTGVAVVGYRGVGDISEVILTTCPIDTTSQIVGGEILFSTRRDKPIEFELKSGFNSRVFSVVNDYDSNAVGIYPNKDIAVTVTLNNDRTAFNSTVIANSGLSDAEDVSDKVYWTPKIHILPFWRWNNGHPIVQGQAPTIRVLDGIEYNGDFQQGVFTNLQHFRTTASGTNDVIFPVSFSSIEATGIVLDPASGNQVSFTIPKHYLTLDGVGKDSLVYDVSFGIKIYGDYYLNFDINRNHSGSSWSRLSIGSGIRQELPPIDLSVNVDGIDVPMQTANPINRHVNLSRVPFQTGFWFRISNDPNYL